MEKKLSCNLGLMILITIIISLMGLLPSSVYGLGSSPQPSVHIAFNMPLSGNLAIFGKPVQDGITMAIEDAKRKEKAKEDQYVVDFQDNQANNRTVVTIAQKQLREKPSIYISGVGINSRTIMDIVSQEDILHLVFGWEIGLVKNRKHVLRPWLHYNFEREEYLKYIKHVGAKKVAIIYDNFAPYVELVEYYLLPDINKISGVEGKAFVSPQNNKDYRTIALQVKEYKPDLVIYDGFPPQFPAVVSALRQFGLLKPGHFLGTMDFIDAPPFLDEKSREGIIFPAPRYVAETESQHAKQWKVAFEKRFGHGPAYTAGYAYDMMNIIIEARRKVADPRNGEQWCKEIRAITPYEGITGIIEFDEEGNLVTPMYLLQYYGSQAKVILRP